MKNSDSQRHQTLRKTDYESADLNERTDGSAARVYNGTGDNERHHQRP